MSNYFNFKKVYIFILFVIIFFCGLVLIFFSRPYTKKGKLIAEINMCKGQLHFFYEIILFYKNDYGEFPKSSGELEKFYMKNFFNKSEKNVKWNLLYCPVSKKKYLYVNKGNILAMDSCYCNELKRINILLKDGTIITAKKKK